MKTPGSSWPAGRLSSPFKERGIFVWHVDSTITTAKIVTKDEARTGQGDWA